MGGFFKGQKGITITNAFQKILDESGCKPKKIWVNKRSNFYNKSMKPWLQDNDIEMYSTHNEEKSVLAERFIGTLKNTIYKKMTSISNNLIFTNQIKKVNKHNNAYH